MAFLPAQVQALGRNPCQRLYRPFATLSKRSMDFFVLPAREYRHRSFGMDSAQFSKFLSICSSSKTSQWKQRQCILQRCDAIIKEAIPANIHLSEASIHF